jgi:hypothetical protein
MTRHRRVIECQARRTRFWGAITSRLHALGLRW